MKSIYIAILITASFCLGITPPVKATKAAPSIVDYGRLPTTSMMEVSPNGKIIAFRKNEGDKDSYIIYSLSEKKILRAIDISEIDPQGTRFITNDTILLWSSQYKKIFGYTGHHNISAAFRLKIKSGSLEQLLIPGNKIFRGQTNVGRFLGVSQDNQKIYMPAYFGEDNTTHSPDYALMEVDLNNPKKLKRIERGTRHTEDYFLDKNSKVLVIEEYDEKHDKHAIKVKADDTWKVIFEKKTAIRDLSPVALTADNQYLVVLQEHNKHDKTAYQLLSLKDGNIEDTPYSKQEKSIEAVFTTVNRIAEGIRYSGFIPSYHFFDNDINDFVNSVVKKFPEHSVWITSHTPNWSHIVVMVEGSQFAGEYYLFDKELNATFLANMRPNITPENIHPIATTSFQARDGLKIPALLTIPRQHAQSFKNLPTIVMPHGGPESYDRIGFDWLAQALANEGYLVFQPQFRGSSGFGADFIRAGYGQWGKKMQDDITDGVHFLRKQGYSNPQKTCIVGASYGGYAALAGGAFTPDLYQCIVAIAPVSDIPLMLKNERRDHGKNSAILAYWRLAIANNQYNKASLKAISPSFHAENFEAPVLLIHGSRDKVVPIYQSKKMRKALKKAKKEVQFLELKKDNHGIIEGENRLEALTHIINFTNQHLN